MYFTYLILSGTFWTFPVKSQVYPKPINYYEPINGPSAPLILKPSKTFSGPLSIYQNNPQDFSWTKNPRNHLFQKAPQKHVLYYPPPKTYHYPYADRFRNFYKNPGFYNYNYFNNNQHQISILRPEMVEPQRENEIETGETRVQFPKPKENGNLFLKNGKIFYPPVPNHFMEPPGFATSDYRIYQKPEKNLDNGQKNNHNFYNNHKMNEGDSIKNSNNRAPYIRDHAPENNELQESSEVEEDESEDDEFPKKISNPSEISPDGDRVEFQIQGHEGPRTYLFGYDTGEGSNRQYRLEEKLKDGTVKGQYGYYDARGKLRSIKYIAKPTEGYQEKHHESSIPDSPD